MGDDKSTHLTGSLWVGNDVIRVEALYSNAKHIWFKVQMHASGSLGLPGPPLSSRSSQRDPLSHLSWWARLQTVTGCPPNLTPFPRLSLTMGVGGGGYPNLILPGARADNGNGSLVTLCCATVLRYTASPSPNPPWLLSMPRSPSPAAKGWASFLQDFATMEGGAGL